MSKLALGMLVISAATFGCVGDQAGDLVAPPVAGATGELQAAAAAGYSLEPVTPPGDYVTVSACTGFYGKALSGGFPPLWLVEEMVTWYTVTPNVLSFDVVNPPKATTTHRSGDIVNVCGRTNGWGRISLNSEQSSYYFDLDVGTPVVASVNIIVPAQMQNNQTENLKAMVLPHLSAPDAALPRDRTHRATWTVTPPALATVTAGPFLRAQGTGTVVVRGTVYGVSGQATVQLLGVNSVTVTRSGGGVGAVRLNESIQLSAVAKDINGAWFTGKTFTWTSSDNAVATVSASGLVRGVKGGQATISATVEGVTGSMVVSVLGVHQVTVTPANGTVRIGETLQMTATPRDANGVAFIGLPVSWASSVPAIATVNATGRVTGVSVKSGFFRSTTITATVDGKSGSAIVNVLPLQMTAWIEGPNLVAYGDYHTWTAGVSNGAAPYWYFWEINYVNVPGWTPINPPDGTGSGSNALTFFVDPSYGSFTLRLTVWSFGDNQQSAPSEWYVTVAGGVWCPPYCDP